MVNVTVYNQAGEKAGQMELNDRVFGQKSKNALLYQVYQAVRANARQPWADTKDRGEVRGGGKKPWKQKGTGRARHGSIRSPIWKGGGVTFGPLSIRNYAQKINQKMKQQSVRMGLSDKVAHEMMFVIDELANDGKTKTIATLRSKFPCVNKSTLFITAEKDDSVMRATQNIPFVSTVRASDVNVVDLMHHQYIVTTKAGVEMLEKRLK